MLSLLKKKTESAAATSQATAWHPNFRNYERLPDIKVVRTMFFVNMGGIATACAVLAFFVLSEYHYYTLNNQLAAMDARISRDKKGSEQAIALFKKFQEEEKKVQEVESFLLARPAFSDLLIHFGNTLPRNIALTSFDLRDNGLTLRGIVRGAPELASGELTAYVDQLRADKMLSALFDEISQTDVSRNPVTGRLNIELFLRSKPAKK
ncbi:MAG: hypothetical protein HZA31_09665 [Opitutae bacterium]|nr:hypothetical protein [Opitutae bacterium]